jgi:transglutaminase-like putative cysteine protease
MKKILGFSLILLILLFAFSQPAKSVSTGENEGNSYLLKSTVQYINPSLTRVWNFTEREEDRTIGLFMNNSWQTVKLLNSTFPVETFENDSDGNSVAVLQFPEPELSSGQNLSFVVWYEITTKPRAIPNIADNESLKLDGIESALVSDYATEEGSWQTSNAALRQLALNLTGNETRVLSIVENFIGWMVNHVVYPKTLHDVPYYPSETYSKLEGDCDDQAILLVTLCRIVGIPAYLQVGCIYLLKPLEEDSYWDNRVTFVQKHIGWHGWAVVYVPPWGWLPVDLTYVSQSPKDDPLNAIKYGAITEPTAVQFENVTHDDYVASSHEARSFLIQNGFEVFAEDEMFLGKGQESSEVLTIPPMNWVPIVFAAVVVLLIGVSLFAVRKRTKR